MKSTKWIKIFFGLSLIGVLFVGGVNYIVDPSQIFNKQKEYYIGSNNIYYIKLDYLFDNHKKYNSYMIGSSRVGTTNPEVINKYIQDSKFYNMWLSGANISDNLNHLKYLLHIGAKIDNLYLQLDVTNLNNIKSNENTHPYVINENNKTYLISRLLNTDIKSIYTRLNEKNDLGFHRVNIQNGVFNYINRDILIKENHLKYVIEEKRFKENINRNLKFITKEDFVTKLKKINKIADENNINLILFVTPHHHKMMDSFEIESYLDFIKTISEQNCFYNFSGYNTVTKNDYNYYEDSHYLEYVGELVAAKIFNDKSVEVPEDFGVLVTKDNIDEHLENLRKQIKEYDLNKILK